MLTLPEPKNILQLSLVSPVIFVVNSMAVHVYNGKKSLAITGQILSLLSPHFPKKQSTLSKKRANPRGLTSRARTLGHFGEREDVSPVYEDDFRVSWSPVSLLVYEKSRFEETLIFGQISNCFFCVCILSDFRAISAPQTSLIGPVSDLQHQTKMFFKNPFGH